MIKSNKKRRAELKMQRDRRQVKAEVKARAERAADLRRRYPESSTAPVKIDLIIHSTFDMPDFVERGYYVDMPFTCKGCGKEEVWTATQQKWWYEVARGDIATRAVRCRPCRRRHREEKAAHRIKSEEGRLRKAQLRT
jgi:hypothetical protein